MYVVMCARVGQKKVRRAANTTAVGWSVRNEKKRDGEHETTVLKGV